MRQPPKQKRSKKNKKSILLVGVPVPDLVEPTQEDGRFWRAYMALAYLKGANGIAKNRLAKLGNSNNIYYGIAALGRELRELGYKVGYLAPSTEENNFFGSIADAAHEYDVVGLSYHTCAEPAARKIARMVKRKNRRVKVIAGGAHCAGLSRVDTASTPIDLYVRGRAHASLPYILDSLDEVIGAHQHDRIYHREETPPVIEQSFCRYSFPIPAADMLNANDIPGARVYTQIGCGKAVPCSFCASLNNHRTKESGNLDAIFAYVDELIASKKTCYLYIGDEDFFMNPEHSLGVVNRLNSYKGVLTYSIQARIETMRTPKGIQLLEKIGLQGMCTKIEVGVESASQKILDLSRKGLRIGHLKEVAGLVHENGMLIDTYWLGGLPGETEATYRQTTVEIAQMLCDGTIDFAKSMQVVPFPGTPLFDQRNVYNTQGVDIRICEPPELGGRCKKRACRLELWRGENSPVFDLFYADKPPLTRNLMRKLYRERIDAMGDALQKRIAREHGIKVLRNLMEPVGVDPLQDMSVL